MRARYNTQLTPFDGFALMDDALRTFRALREPGAWRAASAWAGGPEARVETTDEGWTLSADLPGVKAEDLQIEAEGEVLRVKAHRTEEAPEGYRALHRERGPLRFERAFTFNKGFDAEGISARLDHGVLTLSVPRRAEPEKRAITVQAG